MLYLSDMNLGMSTIQRILMVLYILVKMHLIFLCIFSLDTQDTQEQLERAH
jgi:hypothetical protein